MIRCMGWFVGIITAKGVGERTIAAGLAIGSVGGVALALIS